MAIIFALALCGLASCSASNTASSVDSISANTSGNAQSTVAPGPTTTVVSAPVTISLAFAGDILIHSQVWKAATVYAGGSGYDFTPMFEGVKPIIESVDLGICHLEVPLAPPGQEPSTNPYYGAPKEIVAAIKEVGFDRCSTASNHTFDQGSAGIDATVNEFETMGLGQSGMARTPEEMEPHIFQVKGIKICHLAYTFGFNNQGYPNGEYWRSAKIDPARINADAKKARSLGAQVVIVSMHWGRETQTKISDFQRQNSAAITQSGDINLIVGHNAHVVQNIEQVNGVWTVFGLSNLLSYLPTTDAFPANTQDGMIVTVNITLNPDASVIVEQPVVYPTWVDKKNGLVIRPVLTDLQDPNTPDKIKEELTVSLGRTGKQLSGFFPPAS